MKLAFNIALRGLLVITASLASLNSAADENTASNAYQLAVIKDGAYGAAVIKGDFDTALPSLQLHSATRFDSSTNLCVALTKLGDLDNAQAACTTAYTLSQSSQFSRDRAIALSNLGVLAALRGDFVSARGHFERALEENGQVQQANDNLKLLKHRGATNA
jgi:Flp pilus assembly protein TadD